MKKDIAIIRCARDLKKFKLIGEDNVEDVKFFLNLLWEVAQEEKRMELLAHNEKKVIQFTKDGQKMAEYPSAKIAAKKLKCHRSVIDDSIALGRITRKGHIWKHEQAENIL